MFNRRTVKYCLEEHFYWDGFDLVEVYDSGNSLTKTVVQGQGIDEPMVLIARDFADLDEDEDESEFVTLHFHRNMLGTITHVTWDDEEVVESYEYDAYGEPTFKDGAGQTIDSSAIMNTFLFTAREFDPETGLYWYRFRTYDPASGRFLQRDPLEAPAAPNLYEYCDSHPVLRTDPLGLETDHPNEWFRYGRTEDGKTIWAKEIPLTQADYDKAEANGVRNPIALRITSTDSDEPPPCDCLQCNIRRANGQQFVDVANAPLVRIAFVAVATYSLLVPAKAAAPAFGAGGLAVGERMVKVAFHGAHHSFWGRLMRHVQITVWRAGIKSSGRNYRIPMGFPPRAFWRWLKFW